MVLGIYGQAVEEFLSMIPCRHERVCLDAYVIMPDHVHCIIVMSGPADAGPVGMIHDCPEKGADGPRRGYSDTDEDPQATVRELFNL